MRVVRSFLLMLLAYFAVCLLFPFIFVPCAVIYQLKGYDMSDYFYTIAIGFDQAGGSVLYNEEDWTISGYTYLLANRGNKAAKVFMRLIDMIFGPEHCKMAYEDEIKRGNL